MTVGLAPLQTIERAAGSLPDAVARHLPASGWVVYVLMAGDVPLYVGQTSRPQARIREHAKIHWRWQRVTAVLVQPVLDELEARSIELAFHDDLQPTASTIARGERSKLSRLIAEHS